MISVFYDLETTDSEPIGQILNYAFIALDSDWNIVSKLDGLVHINRLQLPSAGAILANRTNVIEHQKEGAPSEREAMKIIHDYLDGLIYQSNSKINLIGYNSNKFDLNYLRTSFIRNGINPYFFGKLIYRDALLVARKLSCTNKDFPRKATKETPGKLSLKLETLSKEFDILEGAQTHNSYDDVVLTIDFCKVLLDQYNIDVRDYNTFEVEPNIKVGDIVEFQSPQYDLELEEISNINGFLLLAKLDKPPYSLWVNLEKYKENPDQSSVRWFNSSTSSFFAGSKIENQDLDNLAQKALKQFKDLNPSSFFQRSDCDIEQDIFRLGFQNNQILTDAIWSGNKLAVTNSDNQDLKELYLRNRLSEYEWGNSHDDLVLEKLKKYSQNRYLGNLNTSKNPDREKFHPSIDELLTEIEQKIQTSEGDDLILMESLKEFYLNSKIYKLLN